MFAFHSSESCLHCCSTVAPTMPAPPTSDLMFWTFLSRRTRATARSEHRDGPALWVRTTGPNHKDFAFSSGSMPMLSQYGCEEFRTSPPPVHPTSSPPGLGDGDSNESDLGERVLAAPSLAEPWLCEHITGWSPPVAALRTVVGFDLNMMGPNILPEV